MLYDEAKRWRDFRLDVSRVLPCSEEDVWLMAVCEIWDVKGRLDHLIDYAENPEKTANPKYTDADLQAMGDVMKYATNGDKTEQQFFRHGRKLRPDYRKGRDDDSQSTMERPERDCLLPRIPEL